MAMYFVPRVRVRPVATRRARVLVDARARRDVCAHCWATPHSDANLIFKCVNEIYLWFDLKIAVNKIIVFLEIIVFLPLNLQ